MAASTAAAVATGLQKEPSTTDISDGITLKPKKKQSTPSVRSVSFSQEPLPNGTALISSSGDSSSAQHHSLNVKRTITTTTTTTKTTTKTPPKSKSNGVKKDSSASSSATNTPPPPSKKKQPARHPSKSSLNKSLKTPPAKRELSDAAKYARALRYGTQNLPSKGSVGVSTDDPGWAAHLATTSDLKVNLWTAGALRQAQDAASSSITQAPPKFWQPETDKESVSTAAEALRRSRSRTLFPEHKPDPDAAKWASSALSRSDSLIKGSHPSTGAPKGAKAEAHKGAVLADAQADRSVPSRSSSHDIVRAGGVGDLSKLQARATENAKERLSAMNSSVSYYPINFPRDPTISEEAHRAAYIKEAAKRHADLLEVAKRKTDMILDQQDKDLVYQSLYHNRHYNETAYALANERSSQRLANHGKVPIGGNVYMTQSEIDAIAERNVRPVIDEITEKAQEERQHQERRRQEREEQKRQEYERRAQRDAEKRERKEAERKLKAERKMQKKTVTTATTATTTAGGKTTTTAVAATTTTTGGNAAPETKKEPTVVKPVVDPRTAPGPGAGHPNPLITSTLLLEPDGQYIKAKDPKLLEKQLEEERELEQEGRAEASKAASAALKQDEEGLNDDSEKLIDKDVAEQGETEADEAANAALHETQKSEKLLNKDVAEQGEKEADEAAGAALGEDYSNAEKILDKNIANQGEEEADEAATAALEEPKPSGLLLDPAIAKQGEKEADEAATAALEEPKSSGLLLDPVIAQQGEKEADEAATAALDEPEPEGKLLDKNIAEQGEEEAQEAADAAMGEFTPPHDEQHGEKIEVSDEKADDVGQVEPEEVGEAAPGLLAAAAGATAGAISSLVGHPANPEEEQELKSTSSSSTDEYTSDEDEETSSSEGEEEETTTSSSEGETESVASQDEGIDPTAANPAQAIGQTVGQVADDVKRNVSAFREHITE